jgi:hypothetical protein
MTDNEQAIVQIIFGVVGVLIGIGLALARVEPKELRKRSHANPGLALYRFAAYRWAVVAILLLGGIVLSAFGWYSLRAQ